MFCMTEPAENHPVTTQPVAGFCEYDKGHPSSKHRIS
jgi:hypothetical protein